MAEPGTLHDIFIDELRDVYDAEKQLTKALTKLAKSASAAPLRDAFESHLEETRATLPASNRCSPASTSESAASTAMASPESFKRASR